MNQKRVKKIRKMARLATEGLPLVEYHENSQPFFANGRRYPGVPSRMVKRCTRYVFKRMKKEYSLGVA